MKNAQSLKTFRLRNFKAVRDSKTVRFTPFTVLIGNNGSGKSSLIEGLETLQSIAERGLDSAMQQWRGFEHVQNKAVQQTFSALKVGREHQSSPMVFELRGGDQDGTFSAKCEVSRGRDDNELFILSEQIIFGKSRRIERDAQGVVRIFEEKESRKNGKPIKRMSDDESIIGDFLTGIRDWQFVSLNPQAMGAPTFRRSAGRAIRLAKDGSNIAEYLFNIRSVDTSTFNGIIETLQYVLPYAVDLQPTVTAEVERNVFLQLREEEFAVPGWLLSTGTLRIATFLALMRHPTPPPLIVIEEVENGLDPRTVHLIIDEIRNAVESGRTQVIITTHSPYLLDLLLLSQVVLVERIDGQPTFSRPADEESLKEWSEKFSPGQLYTMDLLSQK